MSDLVPEQDLSFEEALAQLEALVARLEAGQLPLAEALAGYERGMGLAAYCSDLLDNAELRVRQIDATTADASEEEFTLHEHIDLFLFEDECEDKH